MKNVMRDHDQALGDHLKNDAGATLSHAALWDFLANATYSFYQSIFWCR